MTGPAITVAMLGARMHYAVPRILHDAGRLGALVTDAYLGEGALRCAVAALAAVPGPGARLSPMLGRHHPGLAGAHILDLRSRAPGLALNRRVTGPRAARRAAKHRAAGALAGLIAARLDDAGGAVYAFQGAALECFGVARARGLGRILEQSIAARPHAEALLAPERADWGHWFTDAGVPAPDPAALARARAEWAQADTILAASEFVRGSLLASGVAAEKIRVVPYGVDLPPTPPRLPNFDGKRPLRLLFAGHADLRKGVHHLLRAAAALGPDAVDLRIAGAVGLRPEIAARFAGAASFHGRVPRADMARLYRWADAVVLPSLVEGSATVSYEALAHGLPLIVTPNAGAPVVDGGEGQVIAPGACAPIALAISRYLEAPDLLAAHAAGARAARPRIGFARYAGDLVAALAPGAGGA